tara:strand:- start:567 stop:1859 length:1293 start_codon:yes stop_codon:yes gene_type:complete
MESIKKLCVVSCPIATRSGYGARSRDFVRALIEQKGDEWDIRILSQRWGDLSMNALTPEDTDLTSRIITKLEQKPDVWFQITIPNEFTPVGHFNVGVSAVIETSDATADFIEGCNRMDLNIVSSEHSKTTLKAVYDKLNDQTKEKVGELRIEKPVEVLFEGYDTNVYDNKKPISKTIEKTLSEIPEQFCFLFVGHWLQGDLGEDRKGIASLVHSFLSTFKTNSFNKKSQPALILKASIGKSSITSVHEIKKKIEIIKEMDGMNGLLPNIYILDGDMTDEEMNSLYNHPKVKAHVSFTHGEGFGRPLLEACVSGKPIIASAWSGHLDFLHPEYNFLIGGELKEIHPSARNKWFQEGSKWFKVNYGQASGTMKAVYDKYKKALEQSRKNRQYVKSNFTFQHMSTKLGEILDEHKAGQGPQQVTLKLPKLKKK